MNAPAPGRSSGTLTIGFGLLSVTCAVYAGAEDVKIKRNMRTPEGHEVGFKCFDKETGEDVAREDTFMVYTCDDGSEVPLSNEEIAKAMGEDDDNAELVGFYPIAQASQYVTNGLMQIRPKAMGKKHPFAKPFMLLMEAMGSKRFALVRWTKGGSPAYGVLTSDGSLRQVRWADEVRAAREMPEVEVSDSEISMAKQLGEALYSKTAPVLENDSVSKVRAYAETKATAMGSTKPEGAVSTTDTKQVFNDLTAALEASIKAVKV